MDTNSENNLERAAVLHGAKLALDVVLGIVERDLFPPDIPDVAKRRVEAIRCKAEFEISGLVDEASNG